MQTGLANGALLACCALNIGVGIALWTSARNAASGRRLASALAVLSGMMMVYPLGWTGRAEVPPWLAFLPLNLPLALGPLLHGYVTVLATGRALRREPTHLIPAAILFVYLTVCLSLPPELQFYWKDTGHDKWVKPFIEAAVLVSLTAYSFASLRLLHRYWNFLSETHSDADRFALRWIGRVLIGVTVTLFLLGAIRIYTWNVGELDGTGLVLWLGLLGAYLGVEGWRHADRPFPTIEEIGEPAAPPSRWRELGEAWRERTDAAQWWRDADLTLTELAKRLGTNSAYLSRAINQGLGCNFNELINCMRAQDVARRIDAGTADNLTRAAFEAGFSSKATFNRAFQAACGMSPSAWRRRLKS